MHEKIEKAKKHFVENKKAYLAATAGVLVGAAATYIVIVRKPPETDAVVTPTIKQGGILNKNVAVMETVLVRRGHPGNVIRCNETGELFASQNRAAQVMGVNPGEVSKNVRGLVPDAGGFTFEIVGEAA